MRYIDSIRRAGRSLKNAKGRTILTSLAISVGAFTLTLALAAGEGARQYVDTILGSNVNKQAVFIARDDALFGGNGNGFGGGAGLQEYNESATTFQGKSYDSLTVEDLNKLQNSPDVREVIPTYVVQSKYFEVEGVEKKYTADVTVYDSTVKAETATGVLPELNTQIADDGVVLPEAFVKKFEEVDNESIIGKTITLHIQQPPKSLTEEEIQEMIVKEGPDAVKEALQPEERQVKLTVVAVSKDSATSLSASRALFISKNKAKELSDYITKNTDQYRRYIATTVLLKEDVDPQVFKTDTEANMGLIVKTAQDLQKLIFQFVNILQGIVMGFAIITLIASVFGIINTQYISVLERTREVGLMKSLGMRGRHVSRLFQLEAAWIGFLGGILGVVLAWIAAYFLNPWILEAAGLGQNLLVFVWWQVAAMVAVLILIAMIAGYIPARKAAKLDPIEALRTE